MDDDGIYHMRPDCLQQYAHYTTGYDDVFRAAVNKASYGEITVDVHQSQIFWVDLDGDKSKDEGEEFIIWSWKGDYMNLGAGAETGENYLAKDGANGRGFLETTILSPEAGIIEREKISQFGNSYKTILFPKQAQEFIFENIEEILSKDVQN